VVGEREIGGGGVGSGTRRRRCSALAAAAGVGGLGRRGSTQQWPRLGWLREVYSLVAVEASDFIGAGGPASCLLPC
jgi:hypothetical protein